MESEGAKRARLSDNQRTDGGGREPETVETDRPGKQQQQGAENSQEPLGGDEQGHAGKAKGAGAGLSRGALYYREHRDDQEWRASQAAKRALREPPKPTDPQRMPTLAREAPRRGEFVEFTCRFSTLVRP